jgi:hypothetical protein
VALDVHIHSFAQQGASNISERWARDDGNRSGGYREGEFVHESRGNIQPGCTGVEENQRSSTTNEKLTDHDVRSVSSLLLGEVVQPPTAGSRRWCSLRRSASWSRCSRGSSGGLLVRAVVGLVARLATGEAGDGEASRNRSRGARWRTSVASSLLGITEVPPSGERATVGVLDRQPTMGSTRGR